MTQVSFYLIEKQDVRQAVIACRLSQKIYTRYRHPIWIQCHTTEQLEQLDHLMWNFEPTAYLPHGIDQRDAPICLSLERPNISFNICINFSGKALNVTELPHSDIHIIEIVGHNEQDRIESREIFKQYRALGYESKVHKI